MDRQEKYRTPLQRPKVAENERQRAKKACMRCQNRKSRCISTARGPCVGCTRAKASCRYETVSTRPRDSESIAMPTPSEDRDTQLSSAATASSLTPTSFPDLVVEDLSSARFNCGGGLNDLLTRVRTSILPEGGSQSPAHMPFKTRTSTPSLQSRLLDESLMRQARNAFPPKHIADFLLGVCIDYGTDFMFYFPQRQFKQKVEEFYSNPNSPLRSNVCFFCMALSAFALGSDFADLVGPATRSSPNTSTISNPGTTFYNAARKLVPDIILSPSTEAVQALILLSSYSIAADARGLCYLHLGLALRVAISLRLHQQTTNTNATDMAFEITNRTWWTVLLMDRITSLKLGLPESIKRSEITTRLPRRHPCLDGGQYVDNFDVVSAYLPLSDIWGSIAFSMPQLLQPMTSEKWQQIQGYADRLQAWKASLPPSLQISETDDESKVSRTVVHLHQNYQHAWIILCRFSLIHQVRERMEKATFYAGKEASITDSERLLSQWCLEAAEGMIRLVELLRDAQKLAQRSFTDFQGCVVAIITLLLYGIIDRNDNYDKYVTSAINSLSFMVGRNEGLVPAFRFVQNFKRITDEAYELCRNSEHTEQSTSSVNEAALAAYESWLSSGGNQRHSQAFVPSSSVDINMDGEDSTTSPHAPGDEHLGDGAQLGESDTSTHGLGLDHAANENWQGASLDLIGFSDAPDWLMAPTSTSTDLFAHMTGLNYFDFGREASRQYEGDGSMFQGA